MHHPYDLTIDTRRAQRARSIKRQLAIVCVCTALTLVSVSLGMLVAANNDMILAILSALIIAAGIWGYCHLLTLR